MSSGEIRKNFQCVFGGHDCYASAIVKPANIIRESGLTQYTLAILRYKIRINVGNIAISTNYGS